LMKEKNKDSALLHEAGEIFMIRKNWQMAVEAFSGANDLNTNDVMSHYYLGLSYLNLKKFNKSYEHFKNTIELKPDFADAYYQIGLIAEKEKDWRKAKDFYEKTLSILPNHLESLKAIKRIYKITTFAAGTYDGTNN